MHVHRLIAGLVLAVALPAFAQTPAPATAPVAPADVPKHNCTKPGRVPGPSRERGPAAAYQKDYIAFTECLKKFALDQQALAEPHMKASNATVAEYNAAVKAYNDEVEKLNAANKCGRRRGR